LPRDFPEAIEDKHIIPQHIKEKLELALAGFQKQLPMLQKLMEILGRATKSLRGDKDYQAQRLAVMQAGLPS